MLGRVGNAVKDVRGGAMRPRSRVAGALAQRTLTTSGKVKEVREHSRVCRLNWVLAPSRIDRDDLNVELPQSVHLRDRELTGSGAALTRAKLHNPNPLRQKLTGQTHAQIDYPGIFREALG